jgi:hypothetical protein
VILQHWGFLHGLRGRIFCCSEARSIWMALSDRIVRFYIFVSLIGYSYIAGLYICVR